MDINSTRQQEARRAVGLPDASIAVHNRHIEPFNIEIRRNSALRDRTFVQSASLGLLHASAVLGYVAGFHSCLVNQGSPSYSYRSSSTMMSEVPIMSVLCLKGGLRTLVGVGVLCGSGLALSLLASCAMERHVYELEYHRELWEIHNFRDGEVSEMIDIYCGMGLKEKDAQTVVDIFAKDSPSMFAQLMMVEELGYTRLPPPTVGEVLRHASLPTVLGYALGVILPLIPLCIPSHPCALSSQKEGSNSLSGSLLEVSDGIVTGTRVKGMLDSSFPSVTWCPPILCSAGLLSVFSVLEGAGKVAVYFGSYAKIRTRVVATVLFFTSAATVFSGAFFVGKYFYPHR